MDGQMFTGNVPGNEASNGDTCVFGDSPGFDVREPIQHQVASNVMKAASFRICTCQKTIFGAT
jgi:hypothetical protein